MGVEDETAGNAHMSANCRQRDRIRPTGARRLCLFDFHLVRAHDLGYEIAVLFLDILFGEKLILPVIELHEEMLVAVVVDI